MIDMVFFKIFSLKIARFSPQIIYQAFHPEHSKPTWFRVNE